MGYRSEVCIVIAHEHQGTQKGKIDIPLVFFRQGMFDFVEQKEHATLFYAESTKWYSCDEEIAEAEKFLRQDIDPEDYLFIRVGENMDDSETEGCFWSNEFDARLIRHVDFNGRDKL